MFPAFAAIAANAGFARNFEFLADPAFLRGRRTGVLYTPCRRATTTRSTRSAFLSAATITGSL